MIRVRLAEILREGVGESITVDEPVHSIGELIPILEQRVPRYTRENDEIINFAVNGAMILHNEKGVALKSGDEVELLVAFSGG